MLTELKDAVKDVFSNKIRGLIGKTVIVTLLVFIVLFCLFAVGISHIELTDSPKLQNLIEIFGYILFFIFSLMLFPPMAAFVCSFFIDSVVERTAQENSGRTLRNVPLSESLLFSGVAAFKGVSLSFLLIPITVVLALIPVVNLLPVALYYGVNGRLLANEYFYSIALRYLTKPEADELFEKNKTYWTKGGIIIAFLMTIPIVNVISPLVAMAFMQRLFFKKQQSA